VTCAFRKHNLEFLVLGNAGAILLGTPVTTVDIDVFVRKTPANLEKLVDRIRLRVTASARRALCHRG